jgi:metal transporter CNNM
LYGQRARQGLGFGVDGFLSLLPRLQSQGANMPDIVIWLSIVFCLSQSAMFSGLNLALFSIGRLRLEVEAKQGDRQAQRILDLRKQSNFALTTILWGNVAINVLLTLLSNSVLAGVTAFLFSTILITFIGEIIPQAYFSRHAKVMASRLVPVLRFYQIVFYPVAKPCAMLLDAWLGQEGIPYFAEREFREVIARHMVHDGTDLDHVEGQGALNFLAFDDVLVAKEGQTLEPDSILAIDCGPGLDHPSFELDADDPLVAAIAASGRKWVVLVDGEGVPRWILDADGLLREVLMNRSQPAKLCHFAHRPIVVSDPSVSLGQIIPRLVVRSEHPHDDVIDQDVILLWGEQKRIITGADILGRLLKGIVDNPPAA